MNKSTTLSALAFSLAAVFFIIVLMPVHARALDGASNAMCAKWNAACPCGAGINEGKKRCTTGGPNTANCAPGICKDNTNNLNIDGICAAQGQCKGVMGQGAGGEGMQQVAQMLGDLMKQLMKGGGGGGGGGAGEPPTDPNANTCATYYQVTVPSSDPCAIYNPTGVLDAAGDTAPSGIGSGLLDALNGGTNTNANTGTKAAATTSTGTKTTPTNTNAQTTGDVKAAAPGLSGDVRIGSAGATIVANLRQGLSEVAGFFGGSTGGASQALSAAGKLCSSRPWAGSFVGNVIPSSFFDGLCEWRGYQPGAATPTNTAKTANIAAQNATAAQQRPGISLQPGVSDVPPEVDIWAEPASVRLGTRTYIFWNARGVAACKGSGPSFSQNTLSGGASTVPITGSTTFNIECLTTASTTITDSVTVQIAI